MSWNPQQSAKIMKQLKDFGALLGALVMRRGVHTVWSDGSGRNSSNPHFRRCGVGYVTDTSERVWLPLPGCRQSLFRAELLAVVRALEDRGPRRVVSDCKGVVKTLQAIQSGHRQPKGRHCVG
eukprot:6158770-Amphidinium_carterae.1